MYLHQEQAFAYYSYIEPVVHNIDHSTEQLVKTDPAFVDNLVDTNNSFADHNRMHTDQLQL